MFSLVFDILEPSAVICTDFSHLEHTGDVCNLLMFLRVFGVCFSLRLFIFPWFLLEMVRSLICQPVDYDLDSGYDDKNHICLAS